MKLNHKTEESINQELDELRQKAEELQKLKAEHKRMLDELREARHELGIRVKIRTAEITKANEDLHRDIAERKRIEAELRETKERLEYILGATKTNVDVIDSAFNLRYVDPAWHKIYGNPAGRKCYEYFMGRSEDCPGCGIPIALKTHKITVTKEVLPRENNRAIEVHTIPFQGQNGEWLVAEFNIDITERGEMQESLQRGEDFLSNIFSSIQDGISVLDEEMNIVRVNKAMEEWYAHAMPLVGKKCYQAYHCRNSPCEICPTIRTLKSREAAYDVVAKIGPEGKIIGWLDLYSFPLLDQKTGKIEGVIEYVRNITGRKQAEEELRQSEERYRCIVENSKDVIMLTNTDGTINYLSPAAKNILGYDPEELVGKQPWIIHPEDLKRVKEAHFKALKGESGEILPYRVITKSGAVRWVSHSWSPISKNGKLDLAVSIIRDVTERKEAQGNWRI